MNTSSYRERAPSQSKKFLAWALSEMTWKVLLGLLLIVYKDDLTQSGSGPWLLSLAIVVTAGFIGIGFILGQAALDKYVRVAEIAAEGFKAQLRPSGGPKPDQEPEPEPTDPKVTR